MDEAALSKRVDQLFLERHLWRVSQNGVVVGILLERADYILAADSGHDYKRVPKVRQ